MHKLLKVFGIFIVAIVLTSMTTPTKNTSSIENCDVVYFINGATFEAKNIIIDDGFIRFKKCDNPDGSTYEVKKSDVSKIEYANGSTIDFKKEAIRNGDIKTDPISIFAFASGGLGILSLFVGGLGGLGILFALGGIIMGFVSKKNIKESKGKLRGKGFANAGIWLGFGFVFLILLALILIILFVGAIL
ncbi:MAG: DUF4190 domain-containing protein [Sphingobacteriales bacterium]|nr:DUF4190 domain-containing protein [Sphingobacteriales bacterium]